MALEGDGQGLAVARTGEEHVATIHRRRLLQLGLGLAATGPGLAWPQAELDPVRRLALYNLHTDEALDTVYWEQGAYVPDALAAANKVLRDFRTGEVHPINPRLLDVLALLSAQVGAKGPFQVISGFRSPATNAMLRAHSAGVASKSLHMDGLAIDICLADTDLARLHSGALALKAGGVGYYPADGFVHVDVGPVRRWQGNAASA